MNTRRARSRFCQCLAKIVSGCRTLANGKQRAPGTVPLPVEGAEGRGTVPGARGSLPAALCQCLAMLPVFCLALATPARAEQPESNPLRYPYGISAKYATAAELATTNLTPGQLVANQEDFSDLRIGDGATPGGLPVGRAVLERCNMLHAWGGATAEEIKAFLALSIADQRPDLEPYATPCIETPDGRQWVAQGRYAASGVPTHVWVPLVSGDAATLRIGMPDGRIFEMVGRYADAESNIVTHAWTEVVE